MARGESGKASAWAWFLGGCLTLLIVIVLGVGACVFMGVRWGRQLQADMKDPKKMADHAAATLGTETLPAGFHAQFAFSIPFLADIAILSDAPPTTDASGDAKPDMGRRGLIFMRLIRMGKKTASLHAYVRGESSDPSALRDSGVNMEVKEVLHRGTLEGNPPLAYVVQRGRVDYTQGGASASGLAAVVTAECPASARVPIGIYYAPDNPDLKAGDPAAFEGTDFDEDRLREIFGAIKMCG